MATIQIAGSVASQLQAGEAILAAARTVDTGLVKARLTAFERAQRDYVAAHAKVQDAEADLSAAQVRLGELDADQDAAVDAVARALINEGRPRLNPFSGLAPQAPGAMMKLAFAEEAAQIHQLVATLRGAPGISKATLAAAAAAEKAATVVERGVGELTGLQAAINTARHNRDGAGQTWATALGALKRAAKAATDDGGVDLHRVLFELAAAPASGTRRRVAKGKPSQPTAAAPPAA